MAREMATAAAVVEISDRKDIDATHPTASPCPTVADMLILSTGGQGVIECGDIESFH